MHHMLQRDFNSHLADDIILGKVKGKLVLRNGTTVETTDLDYNNGNYSNSFPYYLNHYGTYTNKGTIYLNDINDKDIISFIEYTDNTPENTVHIIPIPENCVPLIKTVNNTVVIHWQIKKDKS